LGHTYTKITVHVIFSTKNRLPYLSRNCRGRVFDYLGGILRGMDCDPIAINGVADHVHSLFRVPASVSVADVIRIMKSNSTRWIHEKGILHHTFAWQRGYSAFSVSESCLQGLIRYIADQEMHHSRHSYQEELILFLKQHGISWDERYILD
jgi:putative transposase